MTHSLKRFLIRLWRTVWTERNIYSDSLVASLWTVAGRSLGFFIPFLVAHIFGVNQITDLFFFALGLLQYLVFMFGDTPRGAMAPFLAERSRDPGKVRGFISGLLLWDAASITVLMIALALALGPALTYTTPYSPPAVRAILGMFVGGASLVVLSGCSGVFGSLLNYFKRFRAPAFSPAIRSVVVLASMILLKGALGIYSILLGYVLGEVCCAAFLYERSRARLGFRIELAGAPPRDILHFYRAAFFHVAAAGVGFVNLFILRSAASHLEVGSVTLLQYASVVFYTLSGILIAGFGPVLSAYWAESYHVHGLREQLPRTIRRTALRVLAASAALWLLFAVLRHPVVDLLYGHGRVPDHLIGPLADYSALYALLLVTTALRVVFTRYFIILRNNQLLLLIALVELPVNLLGCFLLLPLGLSGLILALFLHNLAGTAVSWLLFEAGARRGGASSAGA